MEDSRRDLDIDRGEETANSRTMTICSIFALKKEALDFTNQPLPGLENGLLEEKFSLPATQSRLQTWPHNTCRPQHFPLQKPLFMPQNLALLLSSSLLCPVHSAWTFLGGELRCSPLPHWEFPLFPWRCWLGSVVSPCVLFKSWQVALAAPKF